MVWTNLNERGARIGKPHREREKRKPLLNFLSRGVQGNAIRTDLIGKEPEWLGDSRQQVSCARAVSEVRFACVRYLTSERGDDRRLSVALWGDR